MGLPKATLLSVTHSLGGALEQATKLDFGSNKDREVITEFLRDPSAFFGEKAQFLQMSGRNPFGDYAAGSGQIQGILKGMYDAMVTDLETKNGERGRKQKEYEELMETKQEALATLKSSLERTSTQLGEDKKT